MKEITYRFVYDNLYSNEYALNFDVIKEEVEKTRDNFDASRGVAWNSDLIDELDSLLMDIKDEDFESFEGSDLDDDDFGFDTVDDGLPF